MWAEASAGAGTDREADEPRAAESLRRFVGAFSVRVRIVTIVQFFWIAALFAEDRKTSIERYLHELGIGFLALDGAMALLTFVAGRRRVEAPAAARAVRPLAPGRAIESPERARWADAALRGSRQKSSPMDPRSACCESARPAWKCSLPHLVRMFLPASSRSRTERP